MRRLLTVLLGLLLPAALVVGVPAAVPAAVAADPLPFPYPTAPEGDPPGANDWDCEPTAARPTPVILVHGTFGDRRHVLERLSSTLAADGFCVFSLDYGNRGTGPIQESAKQLKAFTGRVLDATGAAKVSMVGHSQGGMMPRYYLKFLGGTEVVDDLVGLAPSNHGTTVTGDPDNPLTGSSAPVVFCRSCIQQSAGSDFLRRLNRGDETPGRVSYTQITTRYDTVVVPHTSGYLEEGRRTTNLTLQDVCPANIADHLRIPADSATIDLTLHALTRKGPADPSYQPVCLPL